jgi:hypothetical protein
MLEQLAREFSAGDRGATRKLASRRESWRRSRTRVSPAISPASCADRHTSDSKVREISITQPEYSTVRGPLKGGTSRISGPSSQSFRRHRSHICPKRKVRLVPACRSLAGRVPRCGAARCGVDLRATAVQFAARHHMHQLAALAWELGCHTHVRQELILQRACSLHCSAYHTRLLLPNGRPVAAPPGSPLEIQPRQ